MSVGLTPSFSSFISLADSGFSFAIKEATTPGIVVCIALLVLSCFSWAVMITKMRVVMKARRQTKQFLEAFRDCENPLSLYHEGTHLNGTPLYGVYMAGAAEIAYQTTGSCETDETFHARVAGGGKIRTTQMQTVTNMMDRAVGDGVQKMESQMTILATAVSGAPFIGLLGTVWGVMDTFSGVAASAGAASLKTMAPGVSSALVTTVIALLVAIPAMFGYNFLVNSIKSLIADVDHFAAELRGEFERFFLDHGTVTPVAAPIIKEATPTIAARRISASELFSGGKEMPEGEPSHRVVKRDGVGAVVSSSDDDTPEFTFDSVDAGQEMLES